MRYTAPWRLATLAIAALIFVAACSSSTGASSSPAGLAGGIHPRVGRPVGRTFGVGGR